jgi:Protein of unknown function (DUF2470)
MNGPHTDDNQLIARAFGSPDAVDATMTTLDDVGGTWMYFVDGVEAEVTVPWSMPISERIEIRREIVVVYENACGRLGLTPRTH